MQLKQVVIKNQKVNYYTVGDPSKQPLIFLHGGAGSHSISLHFQKKLHKELAKKFHVTMPYHPGFRKSPMLSKTWSIQDYYDYVEQFIAFTKVKNPVVWGHSFGGRLAAGYAIQYHKKIKHLVLSNPAMFFDIPRKRGIAYVSRRILPYETYIPNQLKKFMCRATLGKKVSDKELPIAEQIVYTVASSDSKKHVDNLKKISCPILVIWGNHDPVVSKKEAEHICKILPQAKIKTLTMSHFAILFERKKVFRLVKKTVLHP